MIDMIESLMNGEDLYSKALKSAKAFWGDFYAEHADDDDPQLLKAIESAQLPFQWKLEKEAGMVSPDAKSIMALTAIAALYEDGFEDRDLARRVIDLFGSSNTLSGGVKHVSRQVAELYGLDKP